MVKVSDVAPFLGRPPNRPTDREAGSDFSIRYHGLRIEGRRVRQYLIASRCSPLTSQALRKHRRGSPAAPLSEPPAFTRACLHPIRRSLRKRCASIAVDRAPGGAAEWASRVAPLTSGFKLSSALRALHVP